jgi:hypothetical protein
VAGKAAKLDSVLEKAVDVAREAAIDLAGDPAEVGKHLGAGLEAETMVTHLFAASVPGYRGWVWAVTVSRCPDEKRATVCEANLIPADDALLSPPWVPWEDRVQPGDLEGAMVLPYIATDARLVPGYEVTNDADADEMALWELGLGRARVLGAEGRSETAERWYRGSPGPSASSAVAAAAPCQSCAFFVALPGSWRAIFGVCANEWSPSDGKVVSLDHGCGAHSETDVERATGRWPANDPVVDSTVFVPIDLQADDEPEPEPEPERVAATEDDAMPEPDSASEDREPESEASAGEATLPE